MNPITLGMDGLLALLLLIALGVGLRLNGRLKALKASHEGFAVAVRTLDAAAAKADAALKALHAATEDTHDSLLARIDTARALALKLETLGAAAEAAARRAEAAPGVQAPAFSPAASHQAPGQGRPAVAEPAAGSARRSLGELFSARPPAKAAEPGPRAAPRAAAPASPPPHRRSVADDDLFAEAQAGVRPGLTGLMRMSLARSR